MKKKDSQKTLILLDAHAILHRAYHALPGFTSSTGEPTGATYGLSTMLMKIIKDLKPDYIAGCFDLPQPTFRHEAYEAYKQGRAKTEDDLVHQIKRARDVFAALAIPSYELPGFEADDLLATIVEKMKDKKDLRIIIASGDMDTLQLVDDDRVLVYTLKKGINDTILYDEKAVVERFGFVPKLLPDYKGLRGDPSDNIIGIKGIGEKTATTLITMFGSVENMYKKLKKDPEKFRAAGVSPRIITLLEEGEEEALFSKTLATVRRDAPIEFSLPEKEWRENFDLARAETLFAELEFRALRGRLNELNGGANKATLFPEEEKNESVIDPTEFKHAQLALWLLNSDLTTPSLEDMLHYTKKKNFVDAFVALEAEIGKQGLGSVYRDIELPLIPIIEEAQTYGILVDTKHLKKLSETYHKTLDEITTRIYTHAGGEFNMNSPKQLGEVLFDKMGLATKGLKKTEGGARSTRESELVKLREVHPIIAEILLYRELQKLLSTYIDNLPQLTLEDGRLHTTLNQAGTTTGRMSSSNPNLQNIPVRGEMGAAIRSAFVAPEGSTLLACDYSQIEMRVLAALSGDENLFEIFKTGADVHTSVASRVFHVSPQDVTAEMRRRAKVINFGIVYGMGVNALKDNLGSTRVEAQEFYNNYFVTFPKIARYFEDVKSRAKKDGFTTTYFGRRRFFAGLKSPIPYIRASAERMAMNAPLQGTAADIIKIAMKRAHDGLAGAKLLDKAHLLLQIHDELLYEVEEGVVKKARTIIEDAMEHAVDFPVPITVSVKEGPRWGSMEGVERNGIENVEL
ncbi:MAG: polymerase protein [Parcubacteria group bacterium GW2011_GWA1_47_8]|nr:MAG: polymerase protein [Parcubacteria group bacterium GW2011_GWA1_47_8]KKW07534.1 MAG: polymerase protein [Parcubacteria group bacterium GW2011_GWA2_49_16]